MTADPRFELDGQVAIVTGAASGIGEAIARGFAGTGAIVVCVDVSTDANEAVAAGLGNGSFAVTADVRDLDAVDAAVAAALEPTGAIDVLVNSAGIGGRAPAVDYPDDLWKRIMDINLTGLYNVSRAVGRVMLEAGRGSIVNIASIGGLVGFPGSLGYQASKGGVVQLTKTMAVEWADQGVRVNAIAPGHIGTALVRKLWETEPELKDFFESRTPMGYLGDPEDIVGPALFLASGASRMVTGHILPVDGGYVAQ